MSRPINEQTWHRLTTSSSVRVHLMDWPDKGGTTAVRGCRIVQGRPQGPPVPRRYAAAGSYKSGHKGRP